MEIAYEAYLAQQKKRPHGTITNLAKKYNICRAFVYVLLSILKSKMFQIFTPEEQKRKISKKELVSRMLLHRMVGITSIGAISTIMKYDNYDYSSVGSVSQSLSVIGALLPMVQPLPIDEKMEIVAVADEIFIGSQPILITADPQSSLILSIELAKDRTKTTWSEHIDRIESNENIEIVGMVTDEGVGLRSAIADRGIAWQPDTYHAIAHRLGKWVYTLEQRAYKRIAFEYERERVLSSAKTKEVVAKREEKYNKSCEYSDKAISMYEDFSYLYGQLIREIQPFKSNGELRQKESAIANIEVALELMKSLKNEKINAQISTIEGVLPNLLNYFEQSKKAIKECQNLGVKDYIISTLTLAWQWNKAFIKAKKVSRRKEAKSKSLYYLAYAKDILGNEYEMIKEKVFAQLEKIIQASSIVENINSILRPYLERSKNQVTQEFLNLFAYYHNHRRYQAGKRKGKVPMEILTGKKQSKDWIELLTDFIERVEPAFFA